MEDQYLELGLAGIVAAGEPFMAHFGAALLAGWWLERDALLSVDASRAMARQADALMARHSWLFMEHPEFASTDRADEIVEAVNDGLDHAWAIGHDVIYAALVARTLRERPEFAAGWVIDGVVEVLRSCRSQPLEMIGGAFDVRGVDADEIDQEEVATKRALANVTLQAMLDFDHVYLGLHQGDIGHLADHAHALLVLDRLGYGDTASRALRGFREHLAALRRVRHLTADTPEVRARSPVDPRQAAYWDQASSSNDWAVGHLFKYPYAMLDLLDVAEDEDLERPVLRRLGDLVAASP